MKGLKIHENVKLITIMTKEGRAKFKVHYEKFLTLHMKYYNSI